MPEIPGISFVETNEPPPTITDIVNNIHYFIKEIYEKEFNINDIRYNLMGHSLGNTLCVGMINNYPQMIDHFFCVEGQIFVHRSMRVYSDFEVSIYDIPKGDIISVPFLHRNLHAQYFIQRRLSIDNSFIYDLNETENKHIKIHMFHTKYDPRIGIIQQLQYARLKKIPVEYVLFEGNYTHGAFILNNKIREYVIKEIESVYTLTTINNN